MSDSGDDPTILALNKCVAMVSLAIAVTAFELLPLLIVRKGDSNSLGKSANVWLGKTKLNKHSSQEVYTPLLEEENQPIRRSDNTRLDHLLRAGGGVLIATTFLHLLPEVREGVEKLQADHNLPIICLPISELVMCLGFFLMYGTEEMVHKWLMSHPLDEKHSSESHNVENGDKGHMQVDPEKPLRGILVVIAVSIHQVFEGIAVGLEKGVSEMWTLLAAVAAHKLIIALCVGAEIMSGGARFSVRVICLAVFAIASPIGVALGMALSADTGAPTAVDITSSVLQGLATGTLMFVIFFEILVKSTNHGNRVTEYFATLMGFVIMCLLLWIIDS